MRLTSASTASSADIELAHADAHFLKPLPQRFQLPLDELAGTALLDGQVGGKALVGESQMHVDGTQLGRLQTQPKIDAAFAGGDVGVGHNGLANLIGDRSMGCGLRCLRCLGKVDRGRSDTGGTAQGIGRRGAGRLLTIACGMGGPVRRGEIDSRTAQGGGSGLEAVDLEQHLVGKGRARWGGGISVRGRCCRCLQGLRKQGGL